MRGWPCLAFAVALLLCVAVPSRAAPASWTDPGYVYRYTFWGIPIELSRSDAYHRFLFRTVENGPQQFPFATGSKESIPEMVEYREGNDLQRVALRELLQSTGTHAFMVIRDGELLYETYLKDTRATRLTNHGPSRSPSSQHLSESPSRRATSRA